MTDPSGNQLPDLAPILPADPLAQALDAPLPDGAAQVGDPAPRPPADIPAVWRQVAAVEQYLRRERARRAAGPD